MDLKDIEQVLDGAKDYAGSLAIMKREIMNQGFSEEIAEAIVLTTVQGWAYAQRGE